MPLKHVLAFEADPIYAELLRKELESRSVTLTLVTDANEGLEKATSDKPDLIYLCAELPRTSGFSVCYKLRKNPATLSIPVIITSAEATEETIEKHKQLQNLRADEYVHKPFSLDVLRGLLDRYLGGEGSGELLLEEMEEEEVDRDDEMSFEAVAVEDEAALAMDELEELEELEPTAHASASQVDEEVDAFTDSAFASLTEEPVAAPPARSVQPAPPVVSRPAPAATARPGTVPPRTREISGTIDPGLANELSGLRQTNADLERKVARLERENIEAKAGKGGGVSSRELLDLREILNKKDRDLLDIKDEANKKEKQLLDLRERLTDAERTRADLEDKGLGFEKLIADLNDKIAAQAADREVAAKKADDLQGRLSRTQEKSASLEHELDDERRARREERERAEAERTEALSRAAADQARALSELSREKDERLAEVIETLRSELATDKATALEAQAQTLERQALASREAALIEQRQRYEQQLQTAATESERQLDEALERARAAHDARVVDLERGHIAIVEDRDNRIEAATARIAELEASLEASRSERARLEAKLAATEQSVASLYQTVSERDERLAALEADAGAMNDVLAHNEEIVGKTRQALAIATALLEQIEIIETLSPAEEV